MEELRLPAGGITVEVIRSRTKARATLSGLGTIALALALVACAAPAVTPTPETTPDTDATPTPETTPDTDATPTATPIAERARVVLGTGIDATYGLSFVAVDGGFFDRHGIDAEYEIFEMGQLAVDAAAAGQVHISSSSALPGVGPISRGAPLVWVARPVFTGKSGGVGVLPGISSPEDLRGATCGTNFGTVLHLYASLFLEHYGLTDDVELINITSPEAIPAMAANDIQCMILPEPWLTRLTEEIPGSSVPWRYDTDGIYELNFALWFNKDWVDANPEVAERALMALIDTAEWVNDNYDEAADIISRPTRTDKDQILAQMNDLVYTMDMFRATTIEDTRQHALPFGIREGIVETDDPDALLEQVFFPDLMQKVSPERTDY